MNKRSQPPHPEAAAGLSKVPEVTLLFWIIKIAATTLGETGGDAVSMSLGLGYLLSTGIFAAVFIGAVAAILLALLLASLFVWYRTLGSVSVNSISTPPAEMFYWVTIMFSQTLGTALGDWAADTEGLGYLGGTCVFGGALLIVAASYYWTRLSRTLLFWAAFILTRPLGAVVGDLLDKPLGNGGFAFNRTTASAVLLLFIVACILLFPQRAAKQGH
jgi:uncharacterized membrane-anchored protein